MVAGHLLIDDKASITGKQLIFSGFFLLYLSSLLSHFCWKSYGPRLEKTCLRGFLNNKGADQPAHPRRLISAFVIRFWESIISKLAIAEITIF